MRSLNKWNIPCGSTHKDVLIKRQLRHNTAFKSGVFFNNRPTIAIEVEMILIGAMARFAWGEDAAKAVYNSST